MNKIEIAIFSFLFGAAIMNEVHGCKERIYTYLKKKSNDNKNSKCK